MKKKSHNWRFSSLGDTWDEKIKNNIWLKSKYLKIAQNSDRKFDYIQGENFSMCRCKTKINVFTFSKFKLNLPIYMVSLPFSMDEKGFEGDISTVLEGYKHRGIHIFLNLKKEEIETVKDKYAVGTTLSSFQFDNNFSDFDDYIKSLRSSYRRRILLALKKGENLKVEKIKNENYTSSIHEMYMQVLKRSEYPLETLSYNFFKESDFDIYVFKYNELFAAFIAIKIVEDTLYFILCGMNYKIRDEVDLYFNLLIKIIKIAIEKKVKKINFGQTSEESKCKIGSKLQKRYMLLYNKNKIINFLLKKAVKNIEYRSEVVNYRVFKKN
jgi:Tfp pilus assembly protein PilZ